MITRFPTVILLFLLACIPVTSAFAQGGPLTGIVRDTSKAVLVEATVVVMTAQRAVVATTKTDKSGAFTIPNLPDGQYLLIIKYAGFAERQQALTMPSSALDVVMDIAPQGDGVTVTANPGAVSELARTTQPVNLISAEDVAIRAKTVVAQIVDGEVGVHLQRTSPGMAGIFVRGLTGNKVNVFIDGVRYSTGAQRGGVNTFLDLIDPTILEGAEILRGPSSAQYGSDALGGSVQFLTRSPFLSSTGRPDWSGGVSVGGETGHYGGFGQAWIGYATEGFGITGSAAYRQSGNYRPGGDNDSHAAVTRFFGLNSEDFYGTRMDGTGFKQMADQVRVNWLPNDKWLIVGNYIRTRQDGANRWDQILGGDGNLVAELNDLQLDLAYVRFESLSPARWIDHFSATYSINTQREERVNQGGNGNPNASIAHEPERTTVNGVQVMLEKTLWGQEVQFGGDAYWERSTSVSYDVNPLTLAETPRRPRVPSGATYNQGGLFAQTTYDIADSLAITGAIRYGYNVYNASASDAPIVNGAPLWPDDHLNNQNVTFRLGGAYQATNALSFAAAISTGYRAPHMTDLGTLGLTGSGFEVASPDVAGLNAEIGSAADTTAVTTGRPVEQVAAETSLNVDGSVRFRNQRVRMMFGGFVNHIDGNLQKVALILPQGAVGTVIGGEPITSQNANGAVFNNLSTNPILVRANFDNVRLWGLEFEGEVTITDAIVAGVNYTYLRAEDKDTGLAPNIEGGTPAPGGNAWVRFAPRSQNWWVEPYLRFAGDQDHLSSLDLADRRTGANRTRTNIRNFFNNGARARGWISPGPDGVFGNADDFLIATGETLAQIQDRVLGVGVNGAPMFTSVLGYTTFGVRFGIRFGPHTFLLDAENLNDANYRGISWGMDAPGRGVSVRYLYQF